MAHPMRGALGLPLAGSEGPQRTPLTVDEIISHPRFVIARNHYMQVIVDANKSDRAIQHLLHSLARTSLFTVILGQSAREVQSDPSTWLSVGRLREVYAPFGLASPRSFDQMLARMQALGLITFQRLNTDRRVKRIRPTAKMISTDLQWIDDHMSPLALLFPERDDYEPARQHDIRFQRAQRMVSSYHYDQAQNILDFNDPVLALMQRQDANRILYIYLLEALRNGDPFRVNLTYEQAAKAQSTSRTHVRNLLTDLERVGVVELISRGGNDIVLKPALWHSVNIFLAKCMSGHDAIWQLARQVVAAEEAERLQQNFPTQRPPSVI